MVIKELAGLKGSNNLTFKWKTTFTLLLFFSIGFFLVSCKKDSSIDNNSQYYVKYEIDSQTIYSGGKLNVEVKDESNNTVSYTVKQREIWEVNIGPVENGFTAYMKVEAIGGTNDQLKLYPSIYISKDNGPFTLEKTDMSDEFRDEVTISYKIE